MFKNKKEKGNEKSALPRAVRKKVVVSGSASICVLLAALIVFGVAMSLKNEIKVRQEENAAYQQALSDVKHLQSAVENKKTLVKKNGSTIASPILEEQTLYSYITNAAQKFDLTITFVRQAGDTVTENGVATQHYEMMFTGSDTNLKLMLDSLDTLPSAYTIDALSFRVKTDKEWIQRAIDEKTTYGWYEAAEEGAKAESSSNTNSETGSVTEKTTLAEMLDYEKFTLFLDIAFVSTE